MGRKAKPNSVTYKGWSEERIRKHRERSNDAMKKLYQHDDEFRQRAIERSRKADQKLTPEQKAARAEKANTRHKQKYANDPEYKANKLEIAKRYEENLKTDPERLARIKQHRHEYYLKRKASLLAEQNS